ncbi:hypothetical protein O181_095250 [Austropuccinia psidii MF-1]|uniref:Uncharacterized protein n=1 Tax=Austropuccinia psidii MF-1 TaxID=1389203 RepID=A0A9Q3J582_9BASI|nr:hypothetical protein [Austropuccinia psidii MF-1]
MYGGMPPYAYPSSLLFFAHKSLRFCRIPTLHTQILIPVQDPDSVHTNPYACTGSRQFKSLLPPGKAPNNSNNTLCRCSLPKIPTIPYASAGF